MLLELWGEHGELYGKVDVTFKTWHLRDAHVVNAETIACPVRIHNDVQQARLQFTEDGKLFYGGSASFKSPLTRHYRHVAFAPGELMLRPL